MALAAFVAATLLRVPAASGQSDTAPPANRGGSEFRCVAQPAGTVSPAEAPVITAALYDYVGEDTALAIAQRIASDVFHAAGVRLDWVNPCVEPVVPTVYVNVLPDAMAKYASVSDLAIGSALVSSHRAYVFFDRVSARALERRVHPNKLLGFAIAHELGHIMLPDRAHAAEGIMTDHLDFELVRMKALAFTRQQGRQLREYARAAAEPRSALAARR